MTLRLGLGRLVAEELVAVVVGFLERVERAGGEDVGGLGRCLARRRRMPARAVSKPGHVDAQVLVGGQALGDLDGDP